MKATVACLAFALCAAPAFAQQEETGATDDPSLLPAPPVAVKVTSNLRKPGTESMDTPGVARPKSGLDRGLLAEMLSYFYPRPSMRNREEGSAYIEMCVDTNGRSSDINVLRSSGFERLDQASLAVIRNMPFQPATLNGKAVPYCGYIFGISWLLPPEQAEEPQ